MNLRTETTRARRIPGTDKDPVTVSALDSHTQIRRFLEMKPDVCLYEDWVGGDASGCCRRMKDGRPLEQFARAVEGDRTTLSAALQALLPESELQALRQILKRGTELAETGKRLEWLLSPISEIPRKGFGWTGKAARATSFAVAADGGALKVTPKASLKASARIQPGPGYEFKGTPGIAAGFKAPLSSGQISLSRQRSTQTSLLVKFSHADDTRVVQALNDDLPVIARLDDPESLLDCENFKSLRLTTSGKASFGATLKTGRSWIQSKDVPGGAVATRLKAGAGYTVKWDRTGNYRFTLSRARGGRLRIRLTESWKNRAARSLSLGAEVKIGGLRQTLAPVMEEIAQLPDRLDAIVRTYSKPNVLFRDKLREKLKSSDPSLRALVDIAAGGGEAASRRLVNSLIDVLVESAGAGANHWSGLLSGEVDAIVEDALDATPLPPDRRKRLAAIVQSKVGEALDDLEKSLLKDLKAALREDAEPVTATLARFAEGPAEVFDRIDATAESGMAPLKQLLARYQMMEESIARAVATVEKERLAIRYGRAVSDSKAASTLLRLRFDPRSEQAQGLYRQMLGGDFAEAMTAGLDDGNDAITLEDCVFKRAFQRKVTSGLTFNLFGQEIASRRTLSTTIKAQHTVGGQINLFEAAGQVAEEHAAFGEGQSMRVSSLTHFLASPDAPDAFSVQLNYTDRHMKSAELRDYIASLEDAGLIGGGATERIMTMESSLGALERGGRSLQIDTLLELSRDELLRAASNEEDEIIRIAIEEQLKSYRRIRWAGDALGRLADALGGDLSNRIFAWRDYSRFRIKRVLGINGTRMSRTERHVLYLVRGILDRGDELASFIAHWRELGRMGQSIVDDADKLDETTLDEIRELHADMIADLGGWVDARNWIVGRSRENLSPIAAAFLASLRKLGSETAEPLIPIITWTEDSDTRRIAVV